MKRRMGVREVIKFLTPLKKYVIVGLVSTSILLLYLLHSANNEISDLRSTSFSLETANRNNQTTIKQLQEDLLFCEDSGARLVENQRSTTTLYDGIGGELSRLIDQRTPRKERNEDTISVDTGLDLSPEFRLLFQAACSADRDCVQNTP